MNSKKNYLIIGILMALSLVLFAYSYFFFRKSQITPNTDANTYQHHYMMIVEEPESSFWQAVYQSALAEAENSDAYLELAGENLSREYSLEDYLDIGLAAKVDGILICPDGSAEVQKKMKEVSEAGIPIVTIMDDDPDSERISYVGLNSYELGQVYGELVSENMTAETKQVSVMQDANANTTNTDLIINQIKNIANEKSYNSKGVDVESYAVERESNFDTEEVIRDIFIDSEGLPDILVCLDEVDSESASQAAVDYNRVGQVIIIGYYTSERVLEAIQKGVIAATVALDTKSMGGSSVQALNEYIATGYVSDYISVNLTVVNQNNIEEYLK